LKTRNPPKTAKRTKPRWKTTMRSARSRYGIRHQTSSNYGIHRATGCESYCFMITTSYFLGL
jgi:hypothetical protein